MTNFFNTLYYGNTVGQWALAFLLIVLSLVVGRGIYWLFGRWVKRLTAKTETRLDDIIIDMIEEPLVFILVLIGIRLSLGTLTWSNWLGDFIYSGFQFIIPVLIAWLLVRLYGAIHNEYLLPLVEKTDTDLDDLLLPVISSGLKIALWALGIVVGLNNAGYNVAAILAGVGIGGLAFALAAQNTVGNLIGGLNIFLDGHIKTGTRIELRGLNGNLIDGNVVEIGLRNTILRTRYEGRLVNIPNSIVANQDVVNVDSEAGRQMFAVYKLAPTTTHQKVELALSLLKQIAKSHENTQDTVVTGFIQVTEVSRDIMLLYWIKPECSNLKTRTAINLEIIKQFEEHKIAFTDNTRYEYQKQVLL